MNSPLRLFCVMLLLLVPIWEQTPAPGENTPIIRGQAQEIYFYPATGTRLDRKILFAPGDGGWRGFAVVIAQTMASWGYDVYGLNTKRYLMSFTGKTRLKETDVMNDFRQLAQWIMRNGSERITLVGWSEGAGLCVLAAASPENKKIFNGLITIGLTESNVLGWRWIDNLTYITKRDPNEPKFFTADYLPAVSPLPLLMLQSSRDEYISPEAGKRLFSVAREPKRFQLIEARNHRFDGNTEGFFNALREGLEWVNKTAR
ncbi:MAG: hypothetical protein N0A16_04995 [Blastocatellia bacterium]|nr:hypothetical protein [Blastocatellia bacterium]MCS7157069.1 hypothetical protein [Blastocatellia bacterium]MCX7752270.1 hypothetical protein [Blastocatellia bacterium]MDW8167762.1 AcvB/VirJ family lysyl-phosphatidylglycerol hydrolase [Acidobacteriota bacterium]MDW8256583.1 AcvB/VirJ family lysyl-phosphatidylglycerol hydrolase [Acidobacteriota bacterium]